MRSPALRVTLAREAIRYAIAGALTAFVLVGLLGLLATVVR